MKLRKSLFPHLVLCLNEVQLYVCCMAYEKGCKTSWCGCCICYHAIYFLFSCLHRLIKVHDYCIIGLENETCCTFYLIEKVN